MRNAVGKSGTIDMFEAGLPEIFGASKKQYLPRAVKQVVPVLMTWQRGHTDSVPAAGAAIQEFLVCFPA